MHRFSVWKEGGLKWIAHLLYFGRMNNPFAQRIAKHLREVFIGGNWTYVNVRDVLSDVNRDEAFWQNADGHSIVKWTYHIQYFVQAVIPVFEGQPLDAHDQFSFDYPEMADDARWRAFVEEMFANVEKLAHYIEQMPDDHLLQTFVDPNYGDYHRNCWGIIEHTHYHLAQINPLKKEYRKTNAIK